MYRLENEKSLKLYGKGFDKVRNVAEWDSEVSEDRIDEDTWQERYKQEARLVTHTLNKYKCNKVLELGSGPGVLGQLVMKDVVVDYTFVDKEGARKVHEKRGYSGSFFVKDLYNVAELDDLAENYDFVMANDFLEHIANPSEVLRKLYERSADEAYCMFSVPNWRMGHTFIYRGLFDFDNFAYFMSTHGWKPVEVGGSALKTSRFPRLDSEKDMPEHLLDSWNWYFIGKKITDG